MIGPREGHLVLFPSTLYHGTTPFASTAGQPGERLTVAFDAIGSAPPLIDSTSAKRHCCICATTAERIVLEMSLRPPCSCTGGGECSVSRHLVRFVPTRVEIRPQLRGLQMKTFFGSDRKIGLFTSVGMVAMAIASPAMAQDAE